MNLFCWMFLALKVQQNKIFKIFIILKTVQPNFNLELLLKK